LSYASRGLESVRGETDFCGVAGREKLYPHLEKYSTDEAKSKGARRAFPRGLNPLSLRRLSARLKIATTRKERSFGNAMKLCPFKTLPKAGRCLPRPIAHCLRRRSDSQLASAVQPPSTVRVWPLMKPLSFESARKAMARAMSSGEAKRAMGTRCVMSASV